MITHPDPGRTHNRRRDSATAPGPAGMTRPVRPLAALVGSSQRVPVVQGGQVRYVNLDYAASAPALETVAARVNEILPLYASVHRGAGYASLVCTAAYESARATVASFIGAGRSDVVIFTRNTTDALNLLAAAAPGPVVYLDVEHHANLLPWQGRHGRVVTAQPTLAATLSAISAELARQPAALLAVTGASNVTGECLPLPDLAALAHRHGARLAVDGAQLVPHRAVDMAATGLDYLAFSGHKMYAPFGAGVLAGARDWLDAAPPHLAGGGAVREVTASTVTWADSPARHEGGTPNVLGAVALAAACQELSSLPPGAAAAHELALTALLRGGLAALGATVHSIWPDAGEPVGIASFSLPGADASLLATYLSAEHGIGVRDGRFCAHPLLARLGIDRAVRASLGLGSSSEDVSRLLSAVEAFQNQGPSWRYEPAQGGWVPVPDTRPMVDAGPASPCSTP
jgi:selenocysteine lyase/cysteine desulfurase